ncbi:MAG TPA: cobalamin-dependent protein, partial [Bacteroidia bacterium]|nr:cobalamin-dependent protein [Bacteroidia bacterium]
MPSILLTHGYFLNDDPRELEIMKPYSPLGILYISAYLEEHGFGNDVFDSTFSSFEDLCVELKRKSPLVLGIYTNLMTKLNVLRLIRFVREQEDLKHTRIILGGPEVKNHAENFLKFGADVLVVGEGEETMLELVRYYSDVTNEKAEEKSFLSQVPGIAFLSAAHLVVTTPPRSLLKDIDQLPFPNRKKIKLEKYFDAWKSRHGESAISMSTMRGCPYTCKWCSRAVYGQ